MKPFLLGVTVAIVLAMGAAALLSSTQKLEESGVVIDSGWAEQASPRLQRTYAVRLRLMRRLHRITFDWRQARSAHGGLRGIVLAGPSLR